MDSNIDEEDFTPFDECTSTTGSYLHHNNYGPNYTTDNSYCLSPKHMIKIRIVRHYTYLGYLLIILKIPLLLQPSGFTMCIASCFTNILSDVSLPPTSLVIMNLLPPTLCSPMSLQ